MFESAVLTGCDKKYEQNMPWWIYRYRQHCNKPLIFADFGLSDAAREYVTNNVDFVVDVNKVGAGFHWGLKQKAYYKCLDLAKYLLWMDQDCEINGSLEPIFSLMNSENDFCISKDINPLRYPNENVLFENQMQAGLFLTSPRNEVFLQWYESLEAEPNDQKGISQIIFSKYKNSQFIKNIPWDLHCPRLLLEQQLFLTKKIPNVIHWTGTIGDEILRSRIIMDLFSENKDYV
jgi:hypothetical protein